MMIGVVVNKGIIVEAIHCGYRIHKVSLWYGYRDILPYSGTISHCFRRCTVSESIDVACYIANKVDLGLRSLSWCSFICRIWLKSSCYNEHVFILDLILHWPKWEQYTAGITYTKSVFDMDTKKIFNSRHHDLTLQPIQDNYGIDVKWSMLYIYLRVWIGPAGSSWRCDVTTDYLGLPGPSGGVMWRLTTFIIADACDF